MSWAHELRLGVRRVEVRDEEAVVVDQVLRGGALDFGEADKGGRGRVRLVGDLDEMPEVEALAVCAVFEGHGDGGAGREGLGVGERAIVDGEAVIVVGLGPVGLEHVGSANVSSKGAWRVGGRSGEEPVKAVNA